MQLSLPFVENKREFIRYHKIHRDIATFKSGLAKKVHNWFRLTPSFGPDLVQLILDEFHCSKTSTVLDPFAGAGTTLIECQLLNIKSYGFEINPFLYYVGNCSLNWNLKLENITDISLKIKKNFIKHKNNYAKLNCDGLPYDLPKIHNVYRWWRADVLKDLLILKHTIKEETVIYENQYQDFFNLCLAGVLVPDLTNVTLGKLQLHFIDRSGEKINVYETFSNHLQSMIADLKQIKKYPTTNKSRLFNIDSTHVGSLQLEKNIDFVITSPPYPNRYSYVWNTRPFLYFFDFFSVPNEASALDKLTIGGTWGTATSILSKDIIKPYNSIVDKIISPIVDKIRENDNLMANYVMKYFNLLTKQILSMDCLLSPNAKIAYVVGNSWIKGIYVPTDELLSRILSELGLGYSKTWAKRFRKRNSGKNLYESIVYGIK